MTMTCKDGQWAVDSSSIANMFSCTEEGATQNQMGNVMVCKDGQWAYDSTATAEANKCDEEGATKTDSSSMMGMTYATTYVCKDGQWTMNMNMGTGVSGTPCDVEDSTKTENGKSYICKEGKWERDKAAEAEKNKCDEEGATKDSTTNTYGMSMTMTYVCTDGQWKANYTGGGMNFGGDSTGTMPSFGGGMNFGGDSTGTMPSFGGRGDSTGTMPNFGGGNFGTKPVVKDSTAAE